jgi:AraC-like DNA-binding protein
LQRALDYIGRDPSLPEVAGVTGLSPSIFARQFKRAVGIAPTNT